MAASAVLEKKFSAKEISYLLLNAQGDLLAQRWSDGMDVPISPGSLLKPWLAVAYGEQHQNVFPMLHCEGTAGHCWLAHGHGTLALPQAIAFSCNSYFLQIASDVDRGRARQSLARYGLHGPMDGTSDSSMLGLGAEWKESPQALLKAYLTLSTEHGQSIQTMLQDGMVASANHGTAKAIGSVIGMNGAMAKTGTAQCTHHPKSSGDGFSVVIYPAAQPRFAFMVRVHGVPGAASAGVAAAMLQALGAGEER